MAESEPLQGLSCPNCGGVVPIPEGQIIVRCPYCDLRSMVRGERGLPRYQVSQRVAREQAVLALRHFLKSNRAIAGDVSAKATLEEAFLAYLPFWTGWGRVLSWVFGQKRVGSGKNSHYEAREVKIVQEMSWNGAACDVGELGVESVPMTGQKLDPFDAAALHARGMVFEPVGSASDARQAAQQEFESMVQRHAKLDRVAQTFTRFVRQRFGLVYYPLWVLRYRYKGRSFQVVVDGSNGKTLYGKAPGSTFYRAAMLVGGMALGALTAIDGSALMAYLAFAADSDDSLGLLGAALAALVFGFGLMFAAYRKFRYGEQYEYRQHRSASQSGSSSLFKIMDVEKWLDQLS